MGVHAIGRVCVAEGHWPEGVLGLEISGPPVQGLHRRDMLRARSPTGVFSERGGSLSGSLGLGRSCCAEGRFRGQVVGSELILKGSPADSEDLRRFIAIPGDVL